MVNGFTWVSSFYLTYLTRSVNFFVEVKPTPRKTQFFLIHDRSPQHHASRLACGSSHYYARPMIFPSLIILPGQSVSTLTKMHQPSQTHFCSTPTQPGKTISYLRTRVRNRIDKSSRYPPIREESIYFSSTMKNNILSSVH